MCKAVETMLDTAKIEGIDMNRIESIKALMESMNLTLEQAIQALKYPMSEKEKFAAALN